MVAESEGRRANRNADCVPRRRVTAQRQQQSLGLNVVLVDVLIRVGQDAELLCARIVLSRLIHLRADRFAVNEQLARVAYKGEPVDVLAVGREPPLAGGNRVHLRSHLVVAEGFEHDGLGPRCGADRDRLRVRAGMDRTTCSA